MLVSAITPKGEISELRRRLLYDVAQIGFIVLGGALAPYALSASDTSASVVWRLSSGILLIVSAISAILAYRQIHRIAGPKGLALLTGRLVATINPIVVITLNGFLLWNVLNPDSNSGARYLGALLLLLLIATYSFLKAGFEMSALDLNE